MKLHKVLFSSVCLLVLVSCGETEKLSEVSGQGFLKDIVSGQVITCVGEVVYLDSESYLLDYATSLSNYRKAVEKQLKDIYLLDEKVFNESVKKANEARDKLSLGRNSLDKGIEENTISQTVCDAQGNFIFNDVPKGNYLVGTFVQIKLGDKKFITSRVKVTKKNSKVKVIISSYR